MWVAIETLHMYCQHTLTFCPATVKNFVATYGVGDMRQSDKVWRIDLQDDHESCHPVGLRMTLES